MNHLEIARFPEPDSGCAEAMSSLCTRLSHAGSGMKTILITSRYAAEGKSFVAMNMLRTFAGLRKRVVLLDADLRKNGLSGRFRIPSVQSRPDGLAQYLAGTCPVESVVYETNIPNAFIVPAGKAVSNPLQLLNHPGLPALIGYLKDHFDAVLVDAPPAGMTADALEIAGHCDGSLIVVSHRRGKSRDIADVREMIDGTGCRVLGVVLNNVNFRSISSRRYYFSSERYALHDGSRSARKGAGRRKKKESFGK